MKIKGSLIVGVSCIILPFILIAMYDSMPKNYYDLVKKHLDEISDTRDEIIVSSTALEIQREKDSLYYIDESNHFVCRKNGDEEVQIEQVFSFLIYEGDIYYTKMKTEGIYCRENGKAEEKKVWDKEVSMFAVGADEEIICTEKEIICFDRQWKEDSCQKFNSADILRQEWQIGKVGCVGPAANPLWRQKYAEIVRTPETEFYENANLFCGVSCLSNRRLRKTVL